MSDVFRPPMAVQPFPVASFISLLGFFFKKSGGHLFSHIVSNAVPSAAYGLTVVFGMGTGVSRKRIATRCFMTPPPRHLNSNPTPTLFLGPLRLPLSRACAFLAFFLRKEVIQPHLPIRLPCYDFTPVIRPAFGSSLLTVGSLTSGVSDSHGVTGGVYKTRERIHRDILIRDY